LKKILILAYDFPPYVSVGGLRPFNWFKYLSEFGVAPVVITRQWKNTHGNELDYVAAGNSDRDEFEYLGQGTIIRTPYKPNLSNRLLLKYGTSRFRLLRKFVSAFYEVMQFVLPLGPKINIYKGAQRYLKENKVDLIIATGDPFVLFHYANKLSNEFNTPWIADYRDPWSQDIPLQNKPLLRWWSQLNEERLLKKVSTVLTVSDFVSQKIAANYSNTIHIIPNGYDPELIETASLISQQSNVLSIAYAGTIYNWHPIELFLKTFNQWVEQNLNYPVQLNFYGINNQQEVERMINSKFPLLNEAVFFHKRMSNEDLLNKMAKDNVLLLFNYYSFMGTKIYDYLGLKRFILFCFTNDQDALALKDKYYHIDESDSPNLSLQADLIQQTNSGMLIEDSSKLNVALTQIAEEFYSQRKVNCMSINVGQFSRRERTSQLAEIVKDILK
jgi:glycosyltransferase involved in cell wall biosynthesis